VSAVFEPPAADDSSLQVYANVDPLPHKNHGNLRGGQFPFLYDPVYGLPVVHDIAKYGEVLRDIRQGLVKEVLWFGDSSVNDGFNMDGRCLIRYKNGRVRQSVVPSCDARVPYAMQAHGVKVRALVNQQGSARGHVCVSARVSEGEADELSCGLLHLKRSTMSQYNAFSATCCSSRHGVRSEHHETDVASAITCRQWCCSATVAATHTLSCSQHSHHVMNLPTAHRPQGSTLAHHMLRCAGCVATNSAFS
jgi:hypothetical protein